MVETVGIIGLPVVVVVVLVLIQAPGDFKQQQVDKAEMVVLVAAAAAAAADGEVQRIGFLLEVVAVAVTQAAVEAVSDWDVALAVAVAVVAGAITLDRVLQEYQVLWVVEEVRVEMGRL